MMGPRLGSLDVAGGQACDCWGVPRASVLSASFDGPAWSSVRKRLAGGIFPSWSVSWSSSSRPSEGPPRGCSMGSRAGIGRFLILISLRMRILMPWSAREHDRAVDSTQQTVKKGVYIHSTLRTFHSGEFFGGIYIKWGRIYRLAMPHSVPAYIDMVKGSEYTLTALTPQPQTD